jgi:hypothetical protein
MANISKQEAYQIYDQMEKAFNNWWTTLAEDTFELVQREDLGFVPYKTGQLKESGYKVVRDTSFSIGYSAPYAGQVYDSSKYAAQVITDKYTTTVRPYVRQGKQVKGHSKTYNTLGERPVDMGDGEWRTLNLNTQNARRPKNEWIQRAWEVIYSGLSRKDIKYLGLKKRVPVQFPQSRINWRE